MSKEIEARLSALEARVIELQANSIQLAAGEKALLKLLEEVGKHTGKNLFWYKPCIAAFQTISTDAQTRLLKKLAEKDASLASSVAAALERLKK